MKVSLNYVIFMNFKPNKILRITSNTTLIQYPNTNFTKFAKNWIIQIKFYQILNKYLFYKSKYYQIHLRTPKYWDFESFFSICEYQMLSLGCNTPKICQGMFCNKILPHTHLPYHTYNINKIKSLANWKMGVFVLHQLSQ